MQRIALCVTFCVLLAGCATVDPTPVASSPTPVEPVHEQPAAQPAPAPLRHSDFTWSPDDPAVGEDVVFIIWFESDSQGDAIQSTSWTIGGAASDARRPSHGFDTAGDHGVTLHLRSTAGHETWINHTISVAPASPEQEPESDPEPAPGPEAPAPAPTPEPGLVIDCDGESVEPAFMNHGEAETQHGHLVWAVLKTGFRFVAVLDDATATDLEYWTGAGWQTVAPLLPGEAQVYILDELERGGDLCFRFPDGQTHAVKLVNGPNSWDPETGMYTINTLGLANELPAEARVVAGTERYGEILFDATDGWVKSGRNIVLFNDLEEHNTGWTSCYIAFGVLNPDTPTCNRDVDIIWHNDGCAGGAACTYLDGIDDPKQAIWMNYYFQGAPISLDDAGSVLMHEVGHYAFAGMDLYVGDQSCGYHNGLLSIMGSDRDAREFDSAADPCPDASSIPGYEPTWSLMRERFPQIPERDTIQWGPTGGGPENFVHAYGVTF